MVVAPGLESSCAARCSGFGVRPLELAKSLIDDWSVGLWGFEEEEEEEVVAVEEEVKGLRLFRELRLGVKLEAEPSIFLDRDLVVVERAESMESMGSAELDLAGAEELGATEWLERGMWLLVFKMLKRSS